MELCSAPPLTQQEKEVLAKTQKIQRRNNQGGRKKPKSTRSQKPHEGNAIDG